MAERSRRDKSSKFDKLAELKRVREGGKRVWKQEDDELYVEVSEEQYRNIVKGRLQRDDFVVDDGVDGYMDNGMDDWMNEGDDEELDPEEERRNKREAKRKADVRMAKGKLSTKPRARPELPAAAPSISAYRPVISAEAEDTFMTNLLGDLDTAPSASLVAAPSRKRKPSPPPDGASSPTPYRKSRPMYDEASSDVPPEEDFGGASSGDDFDFYKSPQKKARTNTDILPTAKRIARLDMQSGSEDKLFDELEDIDMDAFMDLDNLDEKKGPFKSTTANKPFSPSKGASSSDNKITIKKEPTIAAIPPAKKVGLDTKSAWLSNYASLNVVSSINDELGGGGGSSSLKGKAPNISALEPDGSLRFFWIDYLELDGKIYFIGKLREKNTGTWISCCVAVENIQRNLFVLPREKRAEMDDEGQLIDLDEVPDLLDVYNDFDEIRKQLGISSWKGKFVKRKYAFGDRNVPREETNWLKVVYGFNEPVVPLHAQSPTISSVFGTNTSAFELLVLKRKIMGPCWLNIKKPLVDNRGISWCKLEAVVNDPKDINPFSDADNDAPREMPPLTMMSLSIQTIVNHRENNREIVCVSARTWHNMNIDDATPPEKLPCTVQTYVRPLDHFPPSFETKARSNRKGLITTVSNERTLLNNLLVAIHKADPDVIVGHEFLGVSLDVLLSRMRDLKADHWSRISRFRRQRWPSLGKQGTNLRFLNGRMLCDLASDGAKSMIASTTWSLTEMCETHLKCERVDVDPDDIANYFDGSVSTPDKLLTFVKYCEMDAHYQMAIASKVQILPLTKQLTNLAGNAWNKTLNGGRAERNEYILLHEFHRLKYIVPDKQFGKKTPTHEVENDGGTGAKKGRRDKYKGGLVFEPKRGLWDKFILVMDFNSLYPSIIQEYNIDFTTVSPIEELEDGEDNIPEPPPETVKQGVLPRLIATLVNRRRQVKSLMKDKNATPAALLQYDIKQQALKLTANSMYGCLGFEYSRFYARPLAALTTYKGREILTRTRELAESLALDVVYGDTDSVFVNTNATDLAEALKISADFKRAVNDCYKLLEIDLDGIFQRLLLLQKKKYAALKVEDGSRTTIEVKGLDMKRREYCQLSKSVSEFVLKQILSGDPTEVVVEHIHEYLTDLGQKIRQGERSMDDFIIHKRLGKRPQDYPDAKSLPHVQVALRMQAKGVSARSGDVIPYIFCLPEDFKEGDTKDGQDTKPVVSSISQAGKARHPDEIRRGGSSFQIDFEFYLTNQILPPIERLCDPIEGTDRARLAECLGLDPNRFKTTVGSNSDERTFFSFDSRMSDRERFKNAVPFLIRCQECNGEGTFTPITNQKSSVMQGNTGPCCLACRAPFGDANLQIQLELQIRGFISKYYQGWLVCDDQICAGRTRMMGVYGRRCLKPGCKGSVSFEYSDFDLYTQLRYFASLFDQEDILKDSKGLSDAVAIEAAVRGNSSLLDSLMASTTKYLDHSGRRWINLSNLFSFVRT